MITFILGFFVLLVYLIFQMQYLCDERTFWKYQFIKRFKEYIFRQDLIQIPYYNTGHKIFFYKAIVVIEQLAKYFQLLPLQLPLLPRTMKPQPLLCLNTWKKLPAAKSLRETAPFEVVVHSTSQQALKTVGKIARRLASDFPAAAPAQRTQKPPNKKKRHAVGSCSIRLSGIIQGTLSLLPAFLLRRLPIFDYDWRTQVLRTAGVQK